MFANNKVSKARLSAAVWPTDKSNVLWSGQMLVLVGGCGSGNYKHVSPVPFNTLNPVKQNTKIIEVIMLTKCFENAVEIH